jgi:4-oxalocrotonate tautomerase
MPLVRIDLRKGKDLTYRREIGRVASEAMIAVGVGVPANARFEVVSEHDPDNFLFDAGCLGTALAREELERIDEAAPKGEASGE